MSIQSDQILNVRTTREAAQKSLEALSPEDRERVKGFPLSRFRLRTHVATTPTSLPELEERLGPLSEEMEFNLQNLAEGLDERAHAPKMGGWSVHMSGSLIFCAKGVVLTLTKGEDGLLLKEERVDPPITVDLIECALVPGKVLADCGTPGNVTKIALGWEPSEEDPHARCIGEAHLTDAGEILRVFLAKGYEGAFYTLESALRGRPLF